MPFGTRDHKGNFLTQLTDGAALSSFSSGIDASATVLQSLSNGMAIFQDENLTFANTAFRDIFGIASLPAQTPATLSAQWTQCSSECDLGMLLAARQGAQIEFLSSVTGHWYSMTLSPAPNERMVLMCTDITGFRRRDELLSSANKMEALGQLAGGVAHDFNNVLSIIQGYARMAMKHTETGSIQYGQLERIIQSVQRGAGLTRQLLTFGRNKIIASGTTQLNAFLEEQRNMLLPLLDARIHLTLDLPKDIVYVAATNDLLAQVLLNAVTNARDAMGEAGGSIQIVASRENGMVTIAIHDTGCGMSEETRQRALEPFFTTKPVGKGTGLGLSQIYGLVQQIGGSMDLFSELGRGTSLILRLPQAQPPAEAENLMHDIDAVNQTVLIVDDEPDLLVVMQSILEDKGFKVLTAINGNEALSVQDLHKGPIHWLLSDVVMDDMSGPKLGSLMESVRPETRIIYMSGYPATGQMARIQLPQEAIFMAKPIDPSRLWDIMDNMQKNPDSNVEGLVRLAGSWTQEEQRKR